MNKVYLVNYYNGEEYVSSSLYEKRETAERAAQKYNEEHDYNEYAVITALDVIMG